MASGDTLVLFRPFHAEPVSNPALFDARGGGARMGDDDIERRVLSYAVSDAAVFSYILPRSYADTTGITVYLHWAMATASGSFDIRLRISLERIGDQILDIDSDSFGPIQVSNDITIPASAGLVDVLSFTRTKGSQMDGLLVGEGFRLKVERVAVSGFGLNPEASGNLELLFVEIKET